VIATPRTQRRIVTVLDRVSAYARSIFTGIATYACEYGPWRFVPVLPPIALDGSALRDAGADGVIARVATKPMARAIESAGIPAVNVGPGAFGIPTVRLDDAAVGRLAAEHLLGEDLPHFAYCGLPWVWYSQIRADAFCQTVTAAGRTCDSYVGVPHFDHNTREEHEPQLDAWLLGLPKPVGLMALDDIRARHVADACKRLGLRVPDDVAIVGAGNDPLTCEITDPPISSVALAAERVGFEAARLLDQVMQGRLVPVEPKLVPPVGMVARFSTLVAAPGDADVARAVRFIRESAQHGISVDDVLQEVALSRRTLEIRFRQVLGRSPGEEIRRAKLERAKRLLIETDAGMEGVARGSGFSSANQLSETFRRETGVSPSQFRRQFRAV
jgi:LacI family transcriptional regulator